MGSHATIVTVLPSTVEQIGWMCAALAAGIRVVPMHVGVSATEAIGVIRRTGARGAIVESGGRSESAFAGLIDPREALASSKAAQAAPVSPTERGGAVVLESSGSGGPPKLVERSASAIDAVGRAVVHGFELTPDDCVVFPTPLSHSYGVDVVAGALTVGATLCICRAFDPEQLAAELESNATVLPGVPFVFESLLRFTPAKPTSLRVAVSAGAPLPAAIAKDFHAQWGIQIGQLYGSTELGTVAISIPATESFKDGAIGRPLPGVEFKLRALDPPAIEGDARDGELLIRSPSMATRSIGGELDMDEGWLRTGDLARRSDTGVYWLTGRLNQLINVGAYKVNPSEVEDLLLAHPLVSEAVVVPVEQSATVQRVRAVVVLQAGADAADSSWLRQYLQAHLSRVKVPRVIEFVPSLAKTSLGKIQRDKV
jgi:long-chain acyl-CoA synthetase